MLKKSLCLVLGFMCIGNALGSPKELPLGSFNSSSENDLSLEEDTQTSNIREKEDWEQIIRNSEAYLTKNLFNDDIKTALASRWDGRPINWDAIHTLADNGNSYAQFFWGEKLFNEAISLSDIEKKIAKSIEAYMYIYISGIIGQNPITMQEYVLPNIKKSEGVCEKFFDYAETNSQQVIWLR